MSTLLDDSCLTVVESPTGKYHIEGWFSNTLCGSYVNYGYKAWGYKWKVSIRYLAKTVQGRHSSLWCTRCLNNYKDVDTSAD